MPGPYAQCSAISSGGSEIFWTAVKKHLDRINALPSGPRFLGAIQQTGKRITIKMADTSGNSRASRMPERRCSFRQSSATTTRCSATS